DRGATLLVATTPEVHPGGFRQPVEVHATVLEEPPVLDGEHGVHHHLGNLVERYEAALRPQLAVRESGQQHGLEFISVQTLFALGRDDLIDGPFLDVDHRAFRRVIGLRARMYFDGSFLQSEPAEAALVAFNVAGPAQLCRDLLRRFLVAAVDGLRRAVNLGGVGEDLTAHPAINDLFVFQVVIRRDGDDCDAHHDEDRQGSFDQRVAQVSARGAAGAATATSGYSQFDSHYGLQMPLLSVRRFLDKKRYLSFTT